MHWKLSPLVSLALFFCYVLQAKQWILCSLCVKYKLGPSRFTAEQSAFLFIFLRQCDHLSNVIIAFDCVLCQSTYRAALRMCLRMLGGPRKKFKFNNNLAQIRRYTTIYLYYATRIVYTVHISSVCWHFYVTMLIFAPIWMGFHGAFFIHFVFISFLSLWRQLLIDYIL